jgi:hypothetical protein
MRDALDDAVRAREPVVGNFRCGSYLDLKVGWCSCWSLLFARRLHAPRGLACSAVFLLCPSAIRAAARLVVGEAEIAAAAAAMRAVQCAAAAI